MVTCWLDNVHKASAVWPSTRMKSAISWPHVMSIRHTQDRFTINLEMIQIKLCHFLCA